MMNALLIASMFLAGSTAFAAAESNVILVTLDGVRPQEFFRGDAMPKFWAKHAKEGIVLGDQAQGSVMTVDNPANISLPGYHNLMAGSRQPCVTNDCGRVNVETFPERLVRELRLPREKVALVSCWTKLPLAFESVAGTTFTNGGFEPLIDPVKDASRDSINLSQAKNVPTWEENRFDEYTAAHALRYLQLHKPRFLYVSFNDTDDWAHNGDYSKTLAALRANDAWLDKLFETLASMGSYGANTTVILTTDHGRGNGDQWKHHNAQLPEAKNIWLYARGPRVAQIGVAIGGAAHTHSDVRPTIEKLMGLSPMDCVTCGKAIPEIVAGR